MRHSIFERFVQVDKSISRNHEGSGIGLSLVRSLVDMHGGTIELISEEGKGSEFIIRLPKRIE
jgi:signal transduction histidine kinase